MQQVARSGLVATLKDAASCARSTRLRPVFPEAGSDPRWPKKHVNAGHAPALIPCLEITDAAVPGRKILTALQDPAQYPGDMLELW